MNDIINVVNQAINEGVDVNVHLDLKSTLYLASGIFLAVVFGILLANLIVQ